MRRLGRRAVQRCARGERAVNTQKVSVLPPGVSVTQSRAFQFSCKLTTRRQRSRSRANSCTHWHWEPLSNEKVPRADWRNSELRLTHCIYSSNDGTMLAESRIRPAHTEKSFRPLMTSRCRGFSCRSARHMLGTAVDSFQDATSMFIRCCGQLRLPLLAPSLLHSGTTQQP
jgi:hypothetical protein